jgi:hypothetical protein
MDPVIVAGPWVALPAGVAVVVKRLAMRNRT